MKYMTWSRADLDSCYQDDYDEILVMLAEENEETARRNRQH
jgi:hypothetical protein